VDSSYVSRRIEKITYDEQGGILQEAAALDMQFFEHGGGDSAAWRSERAGVIAAGVRRAGVMIAEEARTLAAEEAPEFAAEAGTWIRRLSARLVSRHRQQLMSRKGQATSAEVEEACSQLADALLTQCKEVIDDLTYMPMPSTMPDPLADQEINAGSLAIVGRKDAIQQAQRLDVGALLIIMSEVRSSVATLRIDPPRRGTLIHQIAAIEAFAERPMPHEGMLLGLVKRLVPMLKMARAEEATEIVAEFLKSHTGVR
jgi:hypothetical protein